MMTRKTFGLILGIVTAGLVSAENVEQLTMRLLKNREYENVVSTLVPDDQKSAVIKELRHIRDGGVYYGSSGSSAIMLLINLNDQEQIQKLFADFLQSENPMATRRAIEDLRRSSQVELIPMLAEYLNEGDDIIIYRDDKVREIMLASYSISSGSIAMEILSRSPDVPEEVRDWASSVIQEKRLGRDRRAVMREWWPENKEHFETKEYDRLRPLAAGPSIDGPPRGEPMPADSHRNKSIPAPPKAEANPTPTDSSDPCETNGVPWFWLVGAGGLGILGLAVFLQRWRA